MAPAADAGSRVTNPEENVTASFSGVSADEEGGAIYNTLNSGVNISGSFTSVQGASRGGAIFNSGTLGEISASFINNTAKVLHFWDDGSIFGGGAIFNSGTIGLISGSSFEGNRANGEKYANGGAVYNTGTIGSELQGGILNSVFRDNSSTFYGGAICNDEAAHIYAISGAFENNSSRLYGGAVFNQGEMDSISADFSRNYVTTDSTVIYGGAIHNEGSMGDVIGDFKGNYAKGVTASVFGGAISNSSKGVISSISGDFLDNYALAGSGAAAQARGGAIRNTGVVGDITGNMSNNYAKGMSETTGGALYNDATVGRITGHFRNNHAESDRYLAFGGAIYNRVAGVIIGDFTNNYALSRNAEKDNVNVRGGAIFTSKAIGPGDGGLGIKGNFRGNYAQIAKGSALGGAIHVENGIVGDIIGDFIDNYVSVTSEEASLCNARGGAIYNYGAVGHITGNFSGNRAVAVSASVQGGAIFNVAPLGNLSGNFTNNSVRSEHALARGGAIYAHSFGSMGDIAGDFIGNSASSAEAEALGGAIYNEGKWGRIINSSFIDNYVQGKGRSLGGAIYTTLDLTLIADASQPSVGNGGDVLIRGNWAGSPDNRQAIYLAKDHMTLTLQALNKGKITFDDKIESVGEFDLLISGNGVESIVTLNQVVDQAAVTSSGVTLRLGLTSDSVSEVLRTSTLQVVSGLVDTADGKMGTYYFKELETAAEARFQIDAALIDGKPSNDVFDVTRINATGLITLSGFVINEFEEAGKAGQSDQVYIFQIIKGAQDDSLMLAFESELRAADQEQAIMSSDDILADYFELWTTDTTNDSVRLHGWRDNLAAWAELQVKDEEIKVFTINEGDTQVLTRDTDAFRGKDLTIKGTTGNTLDLRGHRLLDTVAEDQSVLLSNINLINSAENSITTDGVLHLDSAGLDATLTIVNNKMLKISGTSHLSSSITSDTTEGHDMIIDDSLKVFDNKTIVDIQGAVRNQNITHRGSGSLAGDDFTTVTHLTPSGADSSRPYSTFENNSLYMEGGLFRLDNMGAARLELRDFALTGGVVYIDQSAIDLSTETMGGLDAQKITYTAPTEEEAQPRARAEEAQQDEPAGALAPTLPSEDSLIWLNNFVITGTPRQELVHVKFVDKKLAAAVKDGRGIANGAAPSGTAVITDENLLYDWEVTYNDPRAPQPGMYTLAAKAFTSEVKTASVTDITGSYVSMMQVYNYSFNHADLYSASMRSAQSSHISPPVSQGKGSIAEPLTTSLADTARHRGLWLRTYSSHEEMPLHHGPKVSVNMYGGMIGGDSTMHDLRGDWTSVYSLYGGYLGSGQKYESVRIRQNGAAVGATTTFYKKKFHMAVSASIGTSAAEATGRGGRENFDLFMGGLAARTGYNIELDTARYILQPQLMVTYTCFNVYDYENATGVKIESSPTTVLQFHPTLKLIKNTDSTWAPYVSAGFVYDIFSKRKFRANGIELPHMSVKPYAEYSIGAQRTYGAGHTLYGQITGHSGGRKGAEATIGIRYAM